MHSDRDSRGAGSFVLRRKDRNLVTVTRQSSIGGYQSKRSDRMSSPPIAVSRVRGARIGPSPSNIWRRARGRCFPAYLPTVDISEPTGAGFLKLLPCNSPPRFHPIGLHFSYGGVRTSPLSFIFCNYIGIAYVRY